MDGRTGRIGNRSKLLVSGAVLLVGALIVTGGTFATFNAQTRNPSNTYALGTLVLSDTKQGGSACLSTGGGSTDVNVNNACDILLSLTVKKPGDSGTANLTLGNAGSLAASALRVFSAACADSDASSETYHGTGSPCGKVQLTVQQWSDSGFSNPLACPYGGTSAPNTCDFSDATKTLGAFQSSYGSSATGLSVGSLAAGASTWFTIGVKAPSDTDNTFQGRQAAIDFTWFMQQ